MWRDTWKPEEVVGEDELKRECMEEVNQLSERIALNISCCQAPCEYRILAAGWSVDCIMYRPMVPWRASQAHG